MSFQFTPVDTRPSSTPPRGWRWALLGDVARLESGHTPSRRVPEYWEGGDLPWLSLRDVSSLEDKRIFATHHSPTQAGIDNSSARMLPPETVAFCRTASVGKVAILGREMATSQDFVNWVCGPEVDPEYLYFALRTSSAFFDREKQGSTHKTIYFPTVKQFQVLLPPLPEQKRIAAILDKADEIRRKRAEAIKLTEELLKSAFLEMFGDPVTNPKGWEVRKLGECLAAKPQIGTTKPASPGGSVPVVRVGELGAESVRIEKCGAVELNGRDLEKYRVNTGDVLFVRAIGSEKHLGKSAVLGEIEGPVVFDSHVMRARPHPEKMLPLFFLHWLKSAGGRARFMKKAGRTAVQFNINAGQFQDIDIPLPPVGLQRSFTARVNVVRSCHAVLAQGAGCVGEFVASLTQRAFRGEL